MDEQKGSGNDCVLKENKALIIRPLLGSQEMVLTLIWSNYHVEIQKTFKARIEISRVKRSQH